MLSETGQFQTENASKYLQQLCKHFGHKVDVEFDEKSGSIALGIGQVTLAATDSLLTATTSAEDNDGLQRARHVIDSHLKRFAFREEFEAMEWPAT